MSAAFPRSDGFFSLYGHKNAAAVSIKIIDVDAILSPIGRKHALITQGKINAAQVTGRPR